MCAARRARVARPPGPSSVPRAPPSASFSAFSRALRSLRENFSELHPRASARCSSTLRTSGVRGRRAGPPPPAPTPRPAWPGRSPRRPRRPPGPPPRGCAARLARSLRRILPECAHPDQMSSNGYVHLLSNFQSCSVLFITGGIPANLTIPAFTVQQPPGPGSDVDQDMVFHQLLQGNSKTPPLVATDLSGRVTWYYDLSASGFTLAKVGQSLVPGGTLLLNGVDQYTPVPTAPNVLREIDLAGNPVRETNLAAVNAQLAALGHEPVHAFHHDVQRLADGSTVALAYHRAHHRHQRHPHQLRRRNGPGARPGLPGEVGLGRLRPPGRQPRARPGRGHAAGFPGTDGRRPPPPGGGLAARERRGLVARGRQPDPVGPPPGLGDQDRLPQRGRRRPRRLAAGAGRRLHPQLRGPERRGSPTSTTPTTSTTTR